MAPIVPPKTLSQIMMHGCTVEPTFLVLGSVLPRQRKESVSCSNKVSYTSLPNSTFIIDPEDACSEPCLTNEEGSLVSAPKSLSLCTVESGDEELEQLEQAVSVTKPTDSLEACPAAGSVTTRVSNVLSTAPSTSSVPSSSELPSTAATSADPLMKFGAPSIAGYVRICSPVDSLDIVRHRRASEVTHGDPSNVFAPRGRKFGDMRGLRALGLRGLQILKRVKW
ncbi:hypothetical protein ACGC1H_005228 [Rhizoctonia solani]